MANMSYGCDDYSIHLHNFRSLDLGTPIKHKFDQYHDRYKDIYPGENPINVVVGGDQLYINANTVFGDIVVSQAPCVGAFYRFWLMVVQQRVGLIVMLTRLVENKRVKADVYWPQQHHDLVFGDNLRVRLVSVNVGDTAGIADTADITNDTVNDTTNDTVNDKTNDTNDDADVFISDDADDATNDTAGNTNTDTTDDTTTNATFTTRKIIIYYNGEEFPITQICYNGWVDHDTPTDTKGCMGVISMMKHAHARARGVLIHCSAGVGRTGTIALAYQLARTRGDPIALLAQLRKCRPFSVESEEQFKFALRLANDVIGEDTAIATTSTPTDTPTTNLPPF
jgi:protein tyrosine phosphatase